MSVHGAQSRRAEGQPRCLLLGCNADIASPSRSSRHQDRRRQQGARNPGVSPPFTTTTRHASVGQRHHDHNHDPGREGVERRAGPKTGLTSAPSTIRAPSSPRGKATDSERHRVITARSITATGTGDGQASASRLLKGRTARRQRRATGQGPALASAQTATRCDPPDHRAQPDQSSRVAGSPNCPKSPQSRPPIIFGVLSEIHSAFATISARNGLIHRGKQHLYSITSSAKADNDGGIVRCNNLAVRMLIRNDR
jgi:hypothetical protein